MYGMEKRIYNTASLVIGGMLIVLGLLFLADRLLDIRIGQYIWPFVVIVPGVLLFGLCLNLSGDEGIAFAVIGSIMTMVGVILLFQNSSGLWATWAYAWALVAPTAVGLGLLAYGHLRNRGDLVTAGRIATNVGLVIFLVGFAFFELLLNISGLGLNRWALPLFLIGLGVVMLIGVIRPRRRMW